MKTELNKRLATLECQAAERTRHALLSSTKYTPEEAYALMCKPITTPPLSTDTRSPMEQYMAMLNGPTR